MGFVVSFPVLFSRLNSEIIWISVPSTWYPPYSWSNQIYWGEAYNFSRSVSFSTSLVFVRSIYYPETCIWVLAWEHSFCMKKTLYLWGTCKGFANLHLHLSLVQWPCSLLLLWNSSASWEVKKRTRSWWSGLLKGKWYSGF